MYKCIKCGLDFTPSPSQIRKSYFVCRPCGRIREQRMRDEAKILGKRIKSGTMPYEYHKSYSKQYHLIEEKRLHRNKRTSLYSKQPHIILKNGCRRKTRTLVSQGIIIKKTCEECGDQKVQCHHNDYNNPYDIRWLCYKCHLDYHKKLKALGIKE